MLRCQGVLLRSLGAALALGLALIAQASGAWAADEARPPGFDLLGTWFVVAHYTDDSTANPDTMRWVDEVWVFQEKGSRLLWTKYPIVVFDDWSGRFEARGRNPRSRVLAGWEPNDKQMAQVMEGPRVNTRGSKTKSLKGSPKKGYASISRMQVRSATIVGYQENWTIEGLVEGKPTFSRADMLGAGGGGKAEGQTIFAVTDVGDRPTGTFERDGIRHGTFFMIKTSGVRGLEKKEGTVNERADLSGF